MRLRPEQQQQQQEEEEEEEEEESNGRREGEEARGKCILRARSGLAGIDWPTDRPTDDAYNIKYTHTQTTDTKRHRHRTHRHIHTQRHTDTHTEAYTHTHTHTHTNTHTRDTDTDRRHGHGPVYGVVLPPARLLHANPAPLRLRQQPEQMRREAIRPYKCVYVCMSV